MAVLNDAGKRDRSAEQMAPMDATFKRGVRPKSIASEMHGTSVKAFTPTPTPNAETVTGNGLCTEKTPFSSGLVLGAVKAAYGSEVRNMGPVDSFGATAAETHLESD